MNIPSLPTDNLYKFYAIFGLILMVFGIYLIFNTIEKNIEVQKQWSKADFEFFQDSVFERKNRKDYNYFLKELDSAVKKGDDNSARILGQLLDETTKDYKELFMELESSRLNMVEHNNNVKAIKYKTKVFTFLGLGMSLSGMALLFYGFRNWQDKYQRYIDAEMKWKGMIYEEKLRKKQQEDEANKELDANIQEPEPETESNPDS